MLIQNNRSFLDCTFLSAIAFYRKNWNDTYFKKTSTEHM